MADTRNIDGLLQTLGGCGRFQYILILVLNFCPFPAFFSSYFMSFGRFNPGWRCNDDELININTTTTTIDSDSDHQNTSAGTSISTPITTFTTTTVSNLRDKIKPFDKLEGSCDLYHRCKDVEFNPSASTILTEFGLICDNSWVPSLIISLTMTGAAIGFLFSGYIGDRFGRRATLRGALLALTVLNIVSQFSISWQMYATVEFFIGVCTAFISVQNVLSLEFVVPAWRLGIASIPGWALALCSFSLLAMATKDWIMLKLIASIWAACAFVLLFWVPRSIRFLAINNKQKEFRKVTKKIAFWNKAQIPEDEYLNNILSLNKDEDGLENKKRKNTTVLSLFRKGFRIRSVVIALGFLSLDTTYFAMTYGVSSLPGNLYTNMLILTASEIPANLISVLLGNVAGRRKSMMAMMLMTSAFLFSYSVIDQTSSGSFKTAGTLVSIILAKLSLVSAWYVLATSMLEVYPTSARSTVNSYGKMFSYLGGVLAPLLIPVDTDHLFICYVIMAVLMLCCAFMVLLLPESKGKALMSNWGDTLEINTVELNRDYLM